MSCSGISLLLYIAKYCYLSLDCAGRWGGLRARRSTLCLGEEAAGRTRSRGAARTTGQRRSQNPVTSCPWSGASSNCWAPRAAPAGDRTPGHSAAGLEVMRSLLMRNILGHCANEAEGTTVMARTCITLVESLKPEFHTLRTPLFINPNNAERQEKPVCLLLRCLHCAF